MIEFLKCLRHLFYGFGGKVVLIEGCSVRSVCFTECFGIFICDIWMIFMYCFLIIYEDLERVRGCVEFSRVLKDFGWKYHFCEVEKMVKS